MGLRKQPDQDAPAWLIQRELDTTLQRIRGMVYDDDTLSELKEIHAKALMLYRESGRLIAELERTTPPHSHL